LQFGVECGGALLRRFRFSFRSLLWAGAAAPKAPKQEKPKRQSKALPHSTPNPNSNHQRQQPKITDQSAPLRVIEGSGRKHEGEADGD
jgi:hypothetical protein